MYLFFWPTFTLDDAMTHFCWNASVSIRLNHLHELTCKRLHDHFWLQYLRFANSRGHGKAATGTRTLFLRWRGAASLNSWCVFWESERERHTPFYGQTELARGVHAKEALCTWSTQSSSGLKVQLFLSDGLRHTFGCSGRIGLYEARWVFFNPPCWNFQ